MMMPEILIVPAANRDATTDEFNTGKTIGRYRSVRIRRLPARRPHHHEAQ